MPPSAFRFTENQLAEFQNRGSAAQKAAGTVIEHVQGPAADALKARGGRGSNPETMLYQPCRRALLAHSAVDWVVRMNTGMVVIREPGRAERRVRFGWVGMGDLLGQMLSGELLSIEVKVPGKNGTEEQLASIGRIARNGGCAGVAHSPGECLQIVDLWVAERKRLAGRPLRRQPSTME